MLPTDPPGDRAPHARIVRLQPDAGGWAAGRSHVVPPTHLSVPDAHADRPVPRIVATDPGPERRPDVQIADVAGPEQAADLRGAPRTAPLADRPAPLGPTPGTGPHPPADAPPVGSGWQLDAASEREMERVIFDEGTGAEWRVFERDARSIPGSRGPRCLYFDGEGIVRRVWHYPADWSSMPVSALLALMEHPPLGQR